MKRNSAFKTQTLIRKAKKKKYKLSRTAKEKVTQDKSFYNALYTTLSATIVIWENGIPRQGLIASDTSNIW